MEYNTKLPKNNKGYLVGNRCFENDEAIVDSCCEAWNWFVDMPDRVRQLCSRKWCVA